MSFTRIMISFSQFNVIVQPVLIEYDFEKQIYIILSFRLQKMRRKSVKKSSMFKVQQDKNIFKKFLNQIEYCATASLYPNLLQSIRRTSDTIYDYCYNFNEENPFNRGINYGCRNFGLSFPNSNLLVLKQWIPNALEVFLLGQFNNFNQKSHQMKPSEDEKDVYAIQLDLNQQHIQNESKITLKIIDTEGKIHKMAPPSCKIQENQFGYVCIDIEMPAMKEIKKQDAIVAYTIDLSQIQLGSTLLFIENNEQILSNFNTIILRGLFQSSTLIDKGTLTLQEMKQVRDIINKIKNEMGLKLIIEWSLEPGFVKYGLDNPIQKQLLCQQEGNLYHFNFSKQQVIALYLANLSYYLSVFKIDGYHFKRIDSFCRSEQGQIIVKCLNIMNSRLHQNGFTLASCKKQVPGLNHPILEGGLGFTFTYNYNENFLKSETYLELKQKFDKVLESSNCVALNLDQLTPEHELNFLFAVLVSGKGIFCKGNLTNGNQQLFNKLFSIRKQPELFNEHPKIITAHENVLIVQRGNTNIIFNFGEQCQSLKLDQIHKMEFINSFSRKDPKIQENSIFLEGRSCCVLQK